MIEKTYKPFPETEDKLWEEQIRMHKDLCENDSSKSMWLIENGYDSISLKHNCFFCEQAIRIDPRHVCSPFKAGCPACPGKLIDSTFNCMDDNYDYSKYDGKFVTKLEELNNKRKASK